jgi:transcriptional regulator with XRE-family HTH domain
MIFRNGQPYKPETEIQCRIVERREALGLTLSEVARRVNESDLYGTFSHGTLRNLETEDFEYETRPRTTFNKQLVIALSEALECTVPELATDHELESIREMPYRKSQWPEFLLQKEAEKQPRTSVASPELTAKRLHAYLRQWGYNSNAEIGRVMRRYGISITDKTVGQLFGPKAEAKTRARVLTFEFCQKVSRVFRGPRGTEFFDVQWLITCQEKFCPHCDPRMITY